MTSGKFDFPGKLNFLGKGVREEGDGWRFGMEWKGGREGGREGGRGWREGGRQGMEGGLGWKGGREAGDGGRAGLEGREVIEVSFFLVTRSCEDGDKCLVTFSLVSCERSEHS